MTKRLALIPITLLAYIIGINRGYNAGHNDGMDSTPEEHAAHWTQVP